MQADRYLLRFRKSRWDSAAVTRNRPIIHQIGKLIDKIQGNAELINELNIIRDSLTKSNYEVKIFLNHKFFFVEE
jgi:hypothetical protein